MMDLLVLALLLFDEVCGLCFCKDCVAKSRFIDSSHVPAKNPRPSSGLVSTCVM